METGGPLLFRSLWLFRSWATGQFSPHPNLETNDRACWKERRSTPYPRHVMGNSPLSFGSFLARSRVFITNLLPGGRGVVLDLLAFLVRGFLECASPG
jgi:hypothetical protein